MSLRYSIASSDQLKRSSVLNSGLLGGGLTDIEGAKIVARRIFDMYDRDKDGNINGVELSPMLIDTYKSFNRGFNPEKGDIDSFQKVLDRNKDGRISYADIEELSIKYLVGGKLEFIQSAKKEVIKRSAPPKYTASVLQRLEVARRLFKKFDKDGSGNLTESEVGNLLKESYKETMGISDFNASPEDIHSFMDLVDTDHDGIVHLQDYEVYILESLKEAGIKIEEDQMRL